MKQYCVYITTNKINTTLYIGVIGNLPKRMYEHKNKLVEGFTKKYNTDKLVYFEQTENVMSAIAREKQLKNWHRQWKINLISKFNPEWKDLTGSLLDAETSSAGQISNQTGVGRIAGRTRKDIERQSGKKIVSRNNFLKKEIHGRRQK